MAPKIKPKPFHYDPALEAQIRALKRGLRYTEEDYRLDRKRSKQDYRQQRREIKRNRARNREDFATQLARGLASYANREYDIQLGQRRANEDFGTQLTNLARGEARLGNRQRQQMNAAGVLGGSTSAASAAVRAENLKYAQQPILTAQQRANEDAATALARLGTERSQFQQDIQRGRSRMNQDARVALRTARRAYRRGKYDARTNLLRSRVEAWHGERDLNKQIQFSAAQMRPDLYRF